MDKDRVVALNRYLNLVARARKRGDATEHTYRAFLQELVEALARGVTCTNEPRGTAAGHPDLKVSLGETPLGSIETKDIDADLDAIENTSQLRRYLKHIPNLILTDYLEFRWFQNGSEVLRCRLGTFSAKGALRRNPDGEDKLCDIIDNFTQAEVKSIGSPKELAQRMAALAKLTRRHVLELFASEERKGDLHNLLRAFREVLLPDLDEESFADMYAQTVCYGLFASICNAKFPQTFARENAADNLPATNPFLRRLFHHIVGPDLHSNVREDIERIVFLLRHADIAAILKDFGKRTRQEDPVVHFYETFLTQYDPKLRKSRGVYYTPEPVVSYIVRSVDHLLKEKFGKKEGLADPSVVVLDPACGTGTFLFSVIKLIHERVEAKGQYGAWTSYVRNNLLPRIFGFELLMAPYAVAHLKLGLLLKDTGYDFSGDERLGVYLTNTLEEAARQSDFLFAEFISQEANAATEVKKDKPVMVVLGNPPYSKFSINSSGWIRRLLRGKEEDDAGKADYYSADGRPLGEGTVWIQDDYVKFVRWSQWRIEKTNHGIHAFISNSGFLDNPTLKGMRQSLVTAFDDLYVLDLHGNAKRREVSPDGSSDENVFDIQQGVAIGIFARYSERQSSKVRYASIWGSREGKYGVLARTDIPNTKWESIHPVSPHHFLVPFDDSNQPEYELGHKITESLPSYHSGIITKRDSLAIGWTREEIWQRVLGFANLEVEEARAKYNLPADVRDWRVEWAQRDLRESGLSNSKIISVYYRPFDVRHTYFTGRSRGFVGWPVTEMTRCMLSGSNLAIITSRLTKGEPFRHVQVTRHMSEVICMSPNTSNNGFIFPLYLYPSTSKKSLFDSDEPSDAPGGRQPNLSPEFIKEFSGKLGLEFVPDGKGDLKTTFGPEDVFNYIYAIFHSPTYRKRYAEFLKIDFPRVPLTSDVKLFRKLCALGGELVALHLMESPLLDTLKTKYPKPGNNAVTKVLFTPSPQTSETARPGAAPHERGEEVKPKRGPSVPSPLKGEGKGEGEPGAVWINDDQYFEGIRPEEWEFHIGGYQVLDKWLKDRKKAKRKLTSDDITHYQRIVVAIRNTIRLMSEIDKAIPKWPIE